MGLMPMMVKSTPTFGVGGASIELKKPWGSNFDPGRVPIARAQAMLGIGAAFVGFVGVLLPHPAEFDEAGLLATQAVSFGCGLILLAWSGRIPMWALRSMPLLATVLTTLSIFFTHDATSAYPLFYIWVGLYAFYILPRRQAAFQIAFAIANYVVAVAILDGPPTVPLNTEVHHLVVLVGTLVVGGSLLLYLRRRVEELMGRLSDAARLDLLTDLPNASAIHDALTTELERARLGGRPVSVLIADLDRFKAINERLGHRTGDEVLRRIAMLFRDAIRRVDTVARTGPTEFTVVLPECDESGAYLLAEQLLARVRRGFRDEPVPLTTSAGIATYPLHAATVEELVRSAERALEAAKILGRDRAVITSPEVDEVISGTTRQRPLSTTAHLSTMVSLAQALDLRDSGTAEHSTSVGAYAEMMARELGLDDSRIERVRLAGILHDIGKVGVPDAILCKAGPLDEGEWEEMRKHPEIGARILGTRELVDIREWVLASHERPDGRGYPRGLAGEEIPIEARILAVADAFEAMSSDRIYRPGLGERAAREELVASSATQFDGEVVEAFLHALDRHESVTSAS